MQLVNELISLSLLRIFYCYWKRKDELNIISFFTNGNEQGFYGYIEQFEGYVAKNILFTSNKKPLLFYQERFYSHTPI